MIHFSSHLSVGSPLEWQSSSHCPRKLLGKLYLYAKRSLFFGEEHKATFMRDVIRNKDCFTVSIFHNKNLWFVSPLDTYPLARALPKSLKLWLRRPGFATFSAVALLSTEWSKSLRAACQDTLCQVIKQAPSQREHAGGLPGAACSSRHPALPDSLPMYQHTLLPSAEPMI